MKNKKRKKDILDKLFDTIESIICQQYVSDDDDDDGNIRSTASRILISTTTTTKSGWTNNGKNIIKTLIVHKLRA